MNKYSEENLIEKPAIKLFKEKLGYDFRDCFEEKFGEDGSLGRMEENDVVLVPRLRKALRKLNPGVSDDLLDIAIEEITRDRSILSLEKANKEVYDLLKKGVDVRVTDEEGDVENEERIKVIDFDNPENNDSFLASQFWVSGEMYRRRADLIGFVNGLPLVFIEFKASHKRLKDAYDDNLKDYKNTVPQLFWYNAFIILSNGIDSKMGTISSDWEHFSEWKKIDSEGEEGVVSLDTVIRGVCDKTRLLDIVENFTLFDKSKQGLTKIVAKNHQYLGVNSAIESFEDRKKNDGRLGVFWHTQGSGKSYSMVFFSQKILRKFKGNYTFVVVTDRQELDKQIYKTFDGVGAVTENQVQAKSGKELQQLLKEDHRNIFTLIHKFHIGKGKKYPKLSNRDDIIVMTDEAHRTQYDILALNMRNALPNACFIGFTGTPLMNEERQTRKVFGDYVSIYDFKQSVNDQATVPLFYENRIPELQLKNKDLDEDLEELIETADLNEKEEYKLEREFAREYHLITRDDRLEKIAKDIVKHFVNRGYQGKGLVISIDKATAVKMYDKVKKHWEEYLKELEDKYKNAKDWEKKDLKEKINLMKETDMAVVVSQEQNEIEKFRKKGLDFEKHRKRLVFEDLENRFKDADDKLRLAFVCNMWLTGFDVHSLSTIYLDKPMKNHTLMQAIARANRVFGNKNNGLIVDYVGVFRSLQKALSIYAVGDKDDGTQPIQDKKKLFEQLEKALGVVVDFCSENDVDIEAISKAESFESLKKIEQAVDLLVAHEKNKKKFLSLAYKVNKLFKAVLPDVNANKYYDQCLAIRVLVERINSLEPKADISDLMNNVEELLDESIEAEGYVIKDSIDAIDLSVIDFNKLKKQFEKKEKHILAEKLRGKINAKLKKMVKLNPSRKHYLEKFQKMIDEYNAGAINVEIFFDKLVKFTKELNKEEKRAVSENLNDEELAVFDIMKKDDLSERDKQKIKGAAKGLLEKLKSQKLVLDWKKTQKSRANVMVAIRDNLYDGLPGSYSSDLCSRKADAIYHHVYESYGGDGQSIYRQF